jgi:hypothetical protein
MKEQLIIYFKFLEFKFAFWINEKLIIHKFVVKNITNSENFFSVLIGDMRPVIRNYVIEA